MDALVSIVMSQPQNRDVLAFLEAHGDLLPSRKDTLWSPGGYVLHTHPDLCDLLNSTASALPGHSRVYVCGYKAVVNPEGVICAFGYSMNKLGCRLAPDDFAAALLNGGEPYAEVGPDWVVFSAWSGVARVPVERATDELPKADKKGDEYAAVFAFW